MNTRKGITVLVRREGESAFSNRVYYKTLNVDSTLTRCFSRNSMDVQYDLVGNDGYRYTTQGVSQYFNRDSEKYKEYIQSLEEKYDFKKKTEEVIEEVIEEEYELSAVSYMEL